MFKSTIIYCCSAAIIFYSTLCADGSTRLELIDGSVLSGEIISFKDGVYTVRSPSLGTITIEESQILTIRLEPAETAVGQRGLSKNTSVDQALKVLQQSILSDQQVMQMILSLQNDPDIQELLQDAVIMEAVRSGDVNTLMSSPTFRKILEKPDVRKIQKKVGQE